MHSVRVDTCSGSSTKTTTRTGRFRSPWMAITWTQMVSISRTDFLTPNQIGIVGERLCRRRRLSQLRHWHHLSALEAILMETFANQAVTTLSAAITDVTATSCTVIDATAFPATGNFRIKIDGEILIVTARGGQHLHHHARGRGHDGGHARQRRERHSPLTKGGLEARVANRFISDLYDNKPAAGVKGRLFLPTDGLFLEYDDGAAWHKYGPYRAAQSAAANRLVVGQPGQCHGDVHRQCLGARRPRSRHHQSAASPACPAGRRGQRGHGGLPCNGLATMNGPNGHLSRGRWAGRDDGNFTTLGFPSLAASGYRAFTKRSLHIRRPAGNRRPATTIEILLAADRLFWVKYEWAGKPQAFYYSADGVNWIKWAEDTYLPITAPISSASSSTREQHPEGFHDAGSLGRVLSDGPDRQARHRRFPTGERATGVRRCRSDAACDYDAERPARRAVGRHGSRPRRGGWRDVIHLSAESVAALRRRRTPRRLSRPMRLPLWALGGQDSQLGDAELAFAGAGRAAAGD